MGSIDAGEALRKRELGWASAWPLEIQEGWFCQPQAAIGDGLWQTEADLASPLFFRTDDRSDAPAAGSHAERSRGPLATCVRERRRPLACERK